MLVDIGNKKSFHKTDVLFTYTKKWRWSSQSQVNIYLCVDFHD